ncbi:MAG: hypothetical protein OHK0023_13260 [Anaerolineae bacterium]
MRNSIRRTLPLSYVSVVLLPLLMVGIVLAAVSFLFQYNQALVKQREVARRVETEIEAFIGRLQSELELASIEIRDQSPQQQANTLARLPSYPAIFEELILVDRSGTELVHLSRLEIIGEDDAKTWTASDESFALPRNTKAIVFSAVRIDNETGQPSMTISMPSIDARTGEVDMVLIANIRFKRIWDLVAAVDLSPGENVFITDSLNRIVAHLNPSVVLQSINYPLPSEEGFYRGQSAPTVVIAWRTTNYGTQAFNVVAERNVINALELAILTGVITVVILILALAIAAVAGGRRAQRIIVPIERLVSSATAIKDKSEAFDPNSLADIAKQEDEFGELARTFQAMGQQVIIREQTLKQEVQELRIEIDEAKKSRAVAEITESEFFKDLQSRAVKMRQRTKDLVVPKDEESSAQPQSASSTD